MKRISRMNTISPEKRYYIEEPAVYVDLNECLTVETINFRTPIIRNESDCNPNTFKEREETGPIYFNGIKKGDMLGIKIVDIRNEGHASGGEYDESGYNALLKIEENKVFFPGNLWVYKKMMIGDIYVTPEKINGNPWAEIKTNPSFNGGNMDFNDVCAGNTICFPVSLDGGLLVLGDLHAYQGDGEILGIAAECAGEVDIIGYKESTYISKNPVIIKKMTVLE
jgi:amidase